MDPFPGNWLGAHRADLTLDKAAICMKYENNCSEAHDRLYIYDLKTSDYLEKESIFMFVKVWPYKGRSEKKSFLYEVRIILFFNQFFLYISSDCRPLSLPVCSNG